MPDYEVFAPDDATMRSALSVCGLTQKDGLTAAHVRYCVNYYGAKFTTTGATTTDINGAQVPVRAALPGVYAVVRWVPPNIQLLAFPPAGVTLPTGATASTLPANSPVHFF
jgi:hypothetical protein